MFLKNFLFETNDTIDKYSTLQNVVDKMAENKLHHIVIIDAKKPIGIITEKDIVTFYNKNINFSRKAIDFAVKNLVTLHSTRLVQHALNIMIDNNIRKIIIVNSKNEYIGCVEQEDIVFKFEEQLQQSNMTTHNLVNRDNKAVIIDKETKLKDALQIMLEKNIQSLLISQDNIPVGILSESDVVHLAKEHTEQDISIKNYMKTPLIKVDTSYDVDDMITIMKQKNIRRIVVYDKEYDQYHIINSKDIATNIKGNYTAFLESKLFDTRDTFNALKEYVIEIIDLGDEHVIYWTNGITKMNFDVAIDDNITKVIPEKQWNKIYMKLIQDHIILDTIQINESYFQIKGHYGTIMGENIIKIFLSDITSEVQLKQQLEKINKLQEKLLFDQAKMVQLGEMIGNIAHQWRQPLSNISISASGIQVQNELQQLNDEQLNALTDSIVNNAKYLSKTIDTFRNFVKEKKQTKKLVVQERLDNTLDIILAAFKNNQIELINKIDYSTPVTISMVTGELEQVLMNILNNAKDILLEKKVEEPWVKISTSIEEDRFRIDIEDNGGGIDEDTLPRIFDEYFTTKDSSKGTGIGLYMSRKIVNESFKGDLYAQNTKEGAKFTVVLPINVS